MNINELLKGVDCSCGKQHSCAIDKVYIEKRACRRLSEICRDYSKLLFVADENTFAACGKECVSAVSGKEYLKVIFSGKTVVVPNEDAVNQVFDALDDSDFIVGIGSGVIQDICKYVSVQRKIPYCIVATAPSMDGYASDGAAMIMGGMKVTYPATVPTAILADTEVIANAPIEMIKAGYGDILGKFSALNDWKLSHVVNGEYFCDFVYNLTYDSMMKTLELADGLLNRDETGVATLMEALVTVGIAMSFAGSSRPASGSEHHLSHYFEITGIADGTDYFPHGLDVAYSTVVTSRIREKLAEADFPEKRFVMPDDEYRAEMKRVYKAAADGCIALQQKVGRYESDPVSVYKEREGEIKKILNEVPSSDKIISMLENCGIHMKDFYEMYTEKQLKDAVSYAKELKDRYTVLWMYYDFFGRDNGDVI